ncbi:hypothetical protein K1X76_03065 [bacterium]|nr:hypothetical protein [bacterium]
MKANKVNNDFGLEEITMLEKRDNIIKPVPSPDIKNIDFEDETTYLEPEASNRTWFQKFKEWLGNKK